MQLFVHALRSGELSPVTLKMLTELGVEHTVFSHREAHALEPALHAPTRLAGALHLPNDETGNCAFFAQQLKDIAISDGVDFRFGVLAQGLRVEQQQISGLRTDTGDVQGDAFVVAGGIDSVALLRPLRIRLPMQPVKGTPTVPITGFATRHTSVSWRNFKVAIT